ncbi:MAG TPA: AAA family ATPase, partial [Chloroflexota bacterium]|nr:AAA family ATPase [Chloroflexota bacterium]
MGNAKPVLEREEVVASIERALDSARAGSGRTLFLVGEAGLGKTTMLDCAAELAGCFRTAVARADPIEAGIPFGIFSQLCSDAGLENPIDALGLSGEQARISAFYRALRMLRPGPSGEPLLFLLDDLHWADPDSLALLVFLCRRLRSQAMALIGTLRPWPSAALEGVQRLAQANEANLRTLVPLSGAATLELLQKGTGRAVRPEEMTAAERLCQGNPLLLEQVVTSLRQGRPLEAAGQQRPTTEAELLLSRFVGFSSDARRYAQAASIFGVRFRPELATALAGFPVDEGNAAFAALVAGGVARGTESGWAEFV